MTDALQSALRPVIHFHIYGICVIRTMSAS
jgi:hypothetical protein